MAVYSRELPGINGQRFGRLVALSQFTTNNERCKLRRFAICKCDCGNEKIVATGDLKNGHTKSCGCLKKEGMRPKHGHARVGGMSPEYNSWRGMIQRCTNQKNDKWPRYGGRGITVCQQWQGKDGFKKFIADMGKMPSPGHSIDRINNDGHYEPSNCRWENKFQQSRNTSRNRYLAFRGERKTVAEWSQNTGINYKTLIDRLENCWTVERALSTAVGSNHG